MNRWFSVPVVLLVVMSLVAGARAGWASEGQPQPAALQEAAATVAAEAPRRTVQVILQTEHGFDQGLEAAARRLGARVTHRWPFIQAAGLSVQAGRLRELASLPGVVWISLDDSLAAAGGPGAAGTGLATAYPYAVRAVDAWNLGLSGRGVTIALVDSGVDVSQGAGLADLGGRVVGNISFNSQAKAMADRYGHGTHVAGIAAGNGQFAQGKYVGIAPGANLYNVKFSADDGSGMESDLLNALNWIWENRTAQGLQVVNLSVTAATPQSYKTSPLSVAVERLWNAGLVVVVAAGNRGGASDAVHYPPANNPFVITVGAIDDRGTRDLSDDVQASWSSRGSTQEGLRKPDVLAPGAHMISLKACDACTLIAANPGNAVDGGYFRMGGTSMATPVVAGATALLLEQRPGLTPGQIKWLFMQTARTGKGMKQGDARILDIGAAAAYQGTPGTFTPSLAPAEATSGGTGSTDSHIHWLMSVEY